MENSNNVHSSCVDNDGIQNEYCVVDRPLSDYVCPAPAAQAVAQRIGFVYSNTSDAFCPAVVMDPYGKRSAETLYNVWHIFWTTLPIVFWFAIARFVSQSWPRIAHTQSTSRFALEFVMIMLPTVVSVNVANKYVEYFVLLASVCLLLLPASLGWKRLQRARDVRYDMGRRLRLLTLVRATISILTSLCILAIDFESFPNEFRKSRTYGAGLMDVGIGLFVFSMGLVSRRPRRRTDLVRLLRLVMPTLILGIARTLVIMAIDYHQDEHEYGLHLNAFFTLALTKLFGAICSAVATVDSQLLALGLGILALHETALQSGLSEFVMAPSMARDTFWKANREGIFSLPGFVGLYLIAMYVGQWLQQKNELSFREIMRRMRLLSLGSIVAWLVTAVCIFTVGIARVTCNFGYSAWIVSIVISMSSIFVFIFDFLLYVLLPLPLPSLSKISSLEDASEAAKLIKTTEANNDDRQQQQIFLPTLVEAVNQNGLLFFLVSNVLTGAVNIFLNPSDRTSFESVVILSLYMLTSVGSVYILYRLKIRIA